MSLPPQVIQVKRIKRKLNDGDESNSSDAGVDYLRVDGGSSKRQLSANFIYKRREPLGRDVEKEAGAEAASSSYREQNGRPTIVATQPGDERRWLNGTPRKNESVARTTIAALSQEDSAKSNNGDLLAHVQTPPKALLDTAALAIKGIKPRQFHLSRASQDTLPYTTISGRVGKRNKDAAPAIFVEESARGGSKRKRPGRSSKSDRTSSPSKAQPIQAQQPHMALSIRKHKLPGSDRKAPRPAARNTSTPPAIPSVDEVDEELYPSTKLGDKELDQLVTSMNEFALQHIADNLAKQQERDSRETAFQARRLLESQATRQNLDPSATTSPRANTFKPRPLAKRYAQRQAESARNMIKNGNESAASDDEDMMHDNVTNDDDEYVVETYVRVNVNTIDNSVTPEQVGVLVLETGSDAEEFYGQEDDSDELTEDEEDENAENYYAADYPEDEVDSEDEFDRDAYRLPLGESWDADEYADEYAD